MDPATQVWMPPTGVPATAGKSRTGLILLLVAALVLIMVVPAVMVARSQRQKAQAAGPVQPGAISAPVQPPTAQQTGPVATRKHPIFTLITPPPAGFQGPADVFKAAGVGPLTTPVFTLHGASVSGGMSQRGDGAYFYLVPVGGKDAGQPTAACNNQCASGGWATRAPVPPGKYRLVVKTTASDPWTFDLTETQVSPLSLTVTQGPTTTAVDARGLNDQQTKVFKIIGRRGTDGTMTFGGGAVTESAAVFYLMPAGQPFDPKKAVADSQTAGSGGIGLRLPGPGSYYLVVRTSGAWSLQLATS